MGTVSGAPGANQYPTPEPLSRGLQGVHGSAFVVADTEISTEHRPRVSRVSIGRCADAAFDLYFDERAGLIRLRDALSALIDESERPTRS